MIENIPTDIRDNIKEVYTDSTKLVYHLTKKYFKNAIYCKP